MIATHCARNLVGRKPSLRPARAFLWGFAVPAMRDRLSIDGIMMLLRRLGYAQLSSKNPFLQKSTIAQIVAVEEMVAGLTSPVISRSHSLNVSLSISRAAPAAPGFAGARSYATPDPQHRGVTIADRFLYQVDERRSSGACAAAPSVVGQPLFHDELPFRQFNRPRACNLAVDRVDLLDDDRIARLDAV